ncbi:MAG TPA: helix-turn-helix domain-containing protein [Steroidobacteraceae bacterium]
MSGREIRFLRKQMDLTQAELGRSLGVSDQQVARYEKGAAMPRSADGLLWALYLESTGNNVNLRELLRTLEEYDAPIKERQEFAEEDGVWKPKVAA